MPSFLSPAADFLDRDLPKGDEKRLRAAEFLFRRARIGAQGTRSGILLDIWAVHYSTNEERSIRRARFGHGQVFGRSAFVGHPWETAMRGVIPSLGLWVLYIGLAASLAHGQEPRKGDLSELEQFKELKKLKDEERKLLQEEGKKEFLRLREMFPPDVKVVVYLTKMAKDTKETEIEGYVGGVEVILGEKFLDVRDKPKVPGELNSRTLVLVRGASIVAIKRK